MIGVLADDLTGAAEIGGVAWRYGLDAEVQTTFDPGTNADLVVIDADTRVLDARGAAERTRSIAGSLVQARLDWVFKKVDSVLRGHVLDELAALLESWGRCKALVVCANPGLGRTVTGGQYRIDDRLLHETRFAYDPEYPAHTSDVRELLIGQRALDAAARWPVRVLSLADEWPQCGVIVGETASEGDLASWAQRLDAATCPVGAAEFFAACLRTKGYLPQRESVGLERDGAKALFVSGSTSSYGHLFCRSCEIHGLPVLRMPSAIFCATRLPTEQIEKWSSATARALEQHATAVVAIDQPPRPEPGLPQRLSAFLAELVRQVLDRCQVDHLYVEGGETAQALLRRMGWTRLWIECELGPGVVCSRIPGRERPLLIMKPGSYRWPASVHSGDA
jgi:uncharacterized protein YgbK (DUF1537 family)